MLTHPFPPLISGTTKKLLIGTLPPEDVPFYFSNSTNTRLWDILMAIQKKSDEVGRGGNDLSPTDKMKLLDGLKVGISDIIYKYSRDERNSTMDKHIQPIEYKDLLQVAFENGITELLFVYQSAYKWFLHSLSNNPPVRLNKLRDKFTVGEQQQIQYKGKTIKCTLLPSPLNRGRKGETLSNKLNIYAKHILK